MKTDTGFEASGAAIHKPSWRRFLSLPSTRLGWWSFTLMVAFLLGMIFNGAVLMQLPEGALWRPLLILYGFLLLACGLGAGITAIIALVRMHERSWLVWLPLLAGLFVVFLLLGEFLVPH